MEGIPFSEIGALSPYGIIALGIISILRGWLVPKISHDARVADKDAQIDYLRKALDKRDEQFSTVIKNNELVAKTLEDIKRVATQREAAT